MRGLPILIAVFAGSCFGQQPAYDKAFIGVWNLDLAQSKYASGAGPKAGQIAVNQNGYLLTYQDPPPGAPRAVALAFVRGECYVIGAFDPTFTCSLSTDGPRRGTVTLKMSDNVVRKIEVELTGETTMTVRASGPSGPPVVHEVYTKVTQPPAPEKK